jgi:hypothetical protein
MMLTKPFSVLNFICILITTAFFSSCEDEGAVDCQRAGSTDVTKNFSLSGFDGVSFSQVGNVTIAQGASHAVSVTGPSNVVDQLKVEVLGEDLVIGSERCYNGDYELNIFVTMPELKRVAFSGVGEINSAGTWTTHRLELMLTGVGDITASVEVDSLFTQISGNGEVRLSGTARVQEYRSPGTSTYRAFSVESEKAFIDITGMGTCFVAPTDLLDVTITGTGTIHYKNNPVINQQITGQGSLVNDN